MQCLLWNTARRETALPNKLSNSSEVSWSTRNITRVQFSQTEKKDYFFVLLETRTSFRSLQSFHFALTQHARSGHVCDFRMPTSAPAHFEVTLSIPALRGETLSQQREVQHSLATGVKDGSPRARLQVSRRKWESFQGLPRTFGQALADSRIAFPPRSWQETDSSSPHVPSHLTPLKPLTLSSFLPSFARRRSYGTSESRARAPLGTGPRPGPGTRRACSSPVSTQPSERFRAGSATGPGSAGGRQPRPSLPRRRAPAPHARARARARPGVPGYGGSPPEALRRAGSRQRRQTPARRAGRRCPPPAPAAAAAEPPRQPPRPSAPRAGHRVPGDR